MRTICKKIANDIKEGKKVLMSKKLISNKYKNYFQIDTKIWLHLIKVPTVMFGCVCNLNDWLWNLGDVTRSFWRQKIRKD